MPETVCYRVESSHRKSAFSLSGIAPPCSERSSGHTTFTLIMGPGGYKFGDYWRMGLPLEVLVIVVSVPMILLVWPL
jgi:hypothetical protein